MAELQQGVPRLCAEVLSRSGCGGSPRTGCTPTKPKIVLYKFAFRKLGRTANRIKSVRPIHPVRPTRPIGTYPPRRAGRTTDSGNNGEIPITKNLTIQGNTGKTSDILDADGKNRIFSVASGKKLTLKNLTLENGRGDRGGGIRADSNCTLSMMGCILKSNRVESATIGGGIYASDTIITMKYCTLTGNVARESNGTGSGGVIYAAGNKTLTIENCTFTGNKGDYGGCIRTENNITLTMKNCTFTGNEGRFGGCIYAANSTVRIEGGSIGGTEAGEANNATDSGGSGVGGGLYIHENTTLTLKNCTVTGNTAQAKGGGVYVTGNNVQFIMEGSTIITPAADKNDVYLENDKMITVNNTLSPQGGTAARITRQTTARLRKRLPEAPPARNTASLQ